MAQQALRVPEERSAILRTSPLGRPWETADPFLFCMYHLDSYPEGNDAMGPAVPLRGRLLGQDFSAQDGFSMYHGEVVPGFPQHPHRGFETVTVVRRGLVDHSDSLGARGRYGEGDVQWLTAGSGVQHAEMFPLLRREDPNPLDLFQIWLNLPRERKMAEPHFSMLWSPTIPRLERRDARGRVSEIVVVAGELDGQRAPSPPPDSWASSEGADVAIWTVKLAPGAETTLPAAAPGSNRSLYFYRGASLSIDGVDVPSSSRIELRAECEVMLAGGDEEVELLLLQGRPIGEPVVQHGPFVMNTQDEIRQTFLDYQVTRFGGWPWPNPDPVHPREEGRFAQRPDGGVERP